ncbi:MAG TPA: tyrosine-type recombinase/integrase [Acidimicrobiales bacterium]|nr:tyrosine-type recombinase/integrase [Acidimicrobiales bacterium]
MTNRSREAGPQKEFRVDAVTGEKVPTGRWWFVADIGADQDGRRRQARRRGFASKREAQAELDAMRMQVRERTYVAPKRQSFGAFVTDDWLPAVAVKLEPSTLESYSRNLALHVVPVIGGVQLHDLGGDHLNRLYATLLASGRKDNKPGGLSPRTVRYVATIVHAALKDAVRWKRITTNPADDADPPSASAAKAPEMKVWTGAELLRFLELERDERYFTAWLVLATTGARRGELLGLRWSDVDLDGGHASIRQTITAVRHKVTTRPRTKTGKPRVIELDERTVAALRSWRARQATERLAMGAGYQDAGLVFCHPDGHPFHPDRFSREFDRRVARHGLSRIRLHDIRHSWATLALEAGVDSKLVSERLGHSNISVTVNTYQHVSRKQASGAAEKVAGLIFGAGGA